MQTLSNNVGRIQKIDSLPVEQQQVLVEITPNVALAQAYLGSDYVLDSNYFVSLGDHFVVRGHKVGQKKPLVMSLKLNVAFATKVLGTMGLDVDPSYGSIPMPGQGSIIVRATGPHGAVEGANQHDGITTWPDSKVEPFPAQQNRFYVWGG